MSFLIIDTDKQSTQSLRIQLSEMSDRQVEVGDLATLIGLKKLEASKIPEIVFFDQDGDPKKVETIGEELKLGNINSSMVVIGSARTARFIRYFDTYIQKPIFPRKLKRALIKSFARGQQRRSIIGYLGSPVPSGLVRELSRGPRLWKQLTKIESSDKGALSSAAAMTFSRFGLVFVMPEGLNSSELALVEKIYKDPVGTRITVVGVGKDPEKISKIRNIVDFVVDADSDWDKVLDRLALYRLNLFHSEMLIDEAKDFVSNENLFLGSLSFRRALILDPWNIKAQTGLAELAFEKRRFKTASELYKKILALNPCLPKPYLRLLEMEKKIQGKNSENTLEQAKKYCPKLKQIQSLGQS